MRSDQRESQTPRRISFNGSRKFGRDNMMCRRLTATSSLLLLIAMFSCIPRVSPLSITATQPVASPLALSTLAESSSSSTSLLFPDVDGALASLFGSAKARDAFFANHFRKSAIHLPRIQAEQDSPLEEVSMHNLYDACEFINLRRRGSRDLVDKSKMSFGDLQDYIQTGGSAVISVVEKETGAMHDFKQRLEPCFGQELSFNVYHSGPNGVALNPHYDAYDVFVLQLEGEKTWEIVLPEGSSSTSLTLVPGDLLYIPQGIVHSAKTSSGFACSTHVTIGLDPTMKKL